jgi:hypothetical protein
MDHNFEFNKFDDFEEIKFNNKKKILIMKKAMKKKNFKKENQEIIFNSVEIQKNTLTRVESELVTKNHTKEKLPTEEKQINTQIINEIYMKKKNFNMSNLLKDETIANWNTIATPVTIKSSRIHSSLVRSKLEEVNTNRKLSFNGQRSSYDFTSASSHLSLKEKELKKKNISLFEFPGIKSQEVNKNCQRDISNINNNIHQIKQPVEDYIFFRTHIATLPRMPEQEKSKILKIFRQGIKVKDYLPKQLPKQAYSIFLKKSPVKNFHDKKIKNPMSQNFFNDHYKGVNELRKNYHIKHQDAMTREIGIKLSENFQLVDMNKFSEEYRAYLDLINLDKNDEVENMYLRILTNRFSFRKRIKTELIKQKEYEKQTNKKFTILIWKRVIISAAIHFKKLKISIEEFYKKKYQVLKAYETEGSKIFIQAVKDGDFQKAKRSIMENKFIVNDFDHVSNYFDASTNKRPCIGPVKGTEIT